jgi:5'-deoxynucleotidase
MYSFFALISRMKYIDRWELMRNSRNENLSEHSLDVAVIAHALCVIANKRFGKKLDAEKAALVGIYHDSSEIITGDMPTPVKYYGEEIRDAYKQVEAVAESRLLQKLPDDLRDEFERIYRPDDTESERYMRRLVKAADKISAFIKCVNEENTGNKEFERAKESTEKAIRKMEDELPEVEVFMKEFMPAYGETLDDLLKI